MYYITDEEVRSRKKWIERRLKDLDLEFINSRKGSAEENAIWEEIGNLTHEYYFPLQMYSKIVEMRTDKQLKFNFKKTGS